MEEVSFIKMAGTGNDYIYLDCLDGREVPLSINEIISLSRRKTGIGSDGVVMMLPSKAGKAKMKMWNADGSSSSMCGNALRCIGLYVYKKYGEKEFNLESEAGLHRTKILEQINEFEAVVEIEIGKPYFSAGQIPFDPERLSEDLPSEGPYVSIPVLTSRNKKEEWKHLNDLYGTLVSMGNPHCVIFVEDAKNFPVEEIGPWLESHPSFPAKTNVEFVSIKEDGTFFQRTYERGSGETDACGSGACAVLVASVMEEKGSAKNKIELLGGSLEVEWDRSSNMVVLRGQAKETFRGSFFRESL